MCGIAGILNFEGKRTDREEFFQSAESVLKNRGPDHFGRTEKENVLLAHSRLKVIDLTDDANQPMVSKSGRSAIVFNGEVFNFRELTKEIGFGLKTQSDTEVILELYEKFGIEKTLQKLTGQFAFAIIDFEKKTTVVARDRFGQVPLYYYKNTSFTFSSDIRLITKLYRPGLTLDQNSVHYYLSELSMPQPHTIWREVKQIPPAHYFKIDFSGNIIEQKKYWSLPKKEIDISESEAIEKVEEALKKAIFRQTVSDIPIGCFLSGGVDSGLIVSMLAKELREPLKTFTVGFDFDDFNEFEDAAIVAERYKTDHHEINISTDILSDIEEILDQFGEPFADSSAIPTWYISREIKKNVSVALSGDGGDELFGGYIDYGYACRSENFQKKHPSYFAQNLLGISSKLASRLSKNFPNYGTELEYLQIEEPLQLFRNMGFDPQQVKFFDNVNDFTKKHFNAIWQAEKNNSLTTTLMRSSLQTRLLNDYLVKVDRASMSHALEVRSPFMDHELAELAFSIPNGLKFKEKELKYLLKKLGQKYMYPDIFNRKKRGFGIPIKHWLKEELYDMASGHIHDLVKRDMIVNKNVLALLDEHKNGLKDHTHRIWALLCLEIWLKKNF